ncbi:MAG: ATP-binding cassette domain-containing protein [Anaerolineae bacterium]|nr:ATP-binding cassette domain-containing protein [Anaerolineae bacterium]
MPLSSSTPVQPAPLLQITNATVVKGRGKRILDGLHIEIGEGEHTAIFGPNGSGKSSLIKLIACLHYPLAPRDGPPPVRVFGRDRWNVFELRQHLGIVSPELHSLFADHRHGRLKGVEAVVTGFFASYGLFQHQAVTPQMWDRAREELALLDATHLADKPVEEMSTGEARRILIARALVPNPRALLLDEPTTGLDLLAGYRFMETLRKIARQGRTVILVTHHVEEIIPEVERIILLQAGRVFRDGPKQAVLTTENLSALYDAPIPVAESAGGYYRADLGERSP